MIMINLKFLQVFIFFYCSFQLCTARTSYGTKVNPKRQRPDAPQAHSPINNRSIFIYWNPVESAIGYSIRAYNERIDQLVKHEELITETHFNLTKLEQFDGHRITVAAIYEEAEEDGVFQESEQSAPLYVNNEEICKGGQQLQGCLAHCTSTCEDPDPVCDRRCVRGCQCPSNKPFWDGSKCQPSYMCPVMQGIVLRPQNLQVFSDDQSNNVILTWDRVEGVDEFLVQVMKGSNKEIVLQMPVTSNMALLQGLVRGTQYIFRVSTVNKYQNEKEDPLERSLSPPKKVFAASIYKTGFQAYWIADSRAIRYKVRLLGSDKKTVLFANEKIATPSVIFKDLTPSTQYYVQVASAKIQEKFGGYSDMISVKTTGGDDAADDISDLSSDVSLDFEETTTLPPPTTVPVTTTQSPTTTVRTTTQQPTTTEQTTTQPPTTTEPPTTTVVKAVVVTTTPQTTTTQAPTTTTAPKPVPLCRQKYIAASKKAASATPKERTKIVFPKCKSDGTFITTVCNKTAPFHCSCIDAQTGLDVEWSNYGKYNSKLPINCDDFGSSNTKVLTLKTVNFRETSLSMSWTSSDSTAAYIFQLYKNDELVKVKTIMLNKVTTAWGLTADTAYLVNVLPVDFYGKVGTGKRMTVKTRRSLGLKNLITNDQRFGRSQVDISWDGNGYGSIYSISVQDCEKNILSETEVSHEKANLRDLSPLLCYRIVVKDKKRALQAPLITKVDRLCIEHPVDIIFAFDASKNGVPEKRFFHTRKLALEIVKSISNTDTRVAAIKYARSVEASFNFNKHKTVESVLYGIGNVTYHGSHISNIAFALDYMRVMFFSGTKQNSGFVPRPTALPVVVLFSGGKISNNVANKARMLRQKGAVVIVVGTKGGKGMSDSIASNYKLSFAADTWKELQAAGREITEMTCLSQ